MIKTNDIYYKINTCITLDDNLEEQLDVIDSKLREYILLKIHEAASSKDLDVSALGNESTPQLVQKLSSLIPKNEQPDTLAPFTHYILNLAGIIQGWSIVWWQENDENFIQFPFIEINEEGKWDSIKTHQKTDYAHVFGVVYNVFNERINSKDDEPKHLIKKNKDGNFSI